MKKKNFESKLEMLKEKIAIELEEYENRLLQKEKKEILKMSYETTIRYELVYCINEYYVDEKLIDILLSEKDALDYLYQCYMKNDEINIFEDLLYMVKEVI